MQTSVNDRLGGSEKECKLFFPGAGFCIRWRIRIFDYTVKYQVFITYSPPNIKGIVTIAMKIQ